MALVIACAGLYGTLAYAVARRTREIGIRIAIGARRGVGDLDGDARGAGPDGTRIGDQHSAGARRVTFIASFLFEMQPNDPRAIGIALVTLITAALVASYGPARRAATINPTTALRQD